MKYGKILAELWASLDPGPRQGKVATYIPELARVDADKFGLALHTVGGDSFAAGDAFEKFSLQSVAKVLALSLAISVDASEVWSRVGVEPSGNPFNSLVQLEYEKGIPRNPMINAGALVICDLLGEAFDDPLAELMAFTRTVAGTPDLEYDQAVARSEFETAFRNRALLNLMRDLGNIRGEVETVLRLYTQLCAIAMSCEELARSFVYLADHGKSLPPQYGALTPENIRRINAILLTTGFYDEAGEFAFRVGLPGKSGVGGGIAAVCPDRFAVAAWSPCLGPSGNSVLGTQALASLAKRTESSIF